MKLFNFLAKERPFRLLYAIITIAVTCMAVWNSFQTFILHPVKNDECAWYPMPGHTATKGLIISEVLSDGVAGRAGLKNGDTLIRFNNIDVVSIKQASELLNNVPDGSTAKYTVLRNGQTFTFNVKVRKLLNIIAVTATELGFWFMIVGFIVVFTKPLGTIQRRFWLYSLSVMALFTLPSITFSYEISTKIEQQFYQSGFQGVFQNIGFDAIVWLYSGIVLLVLSPLLITYFFTFPSAIISKRIRTFLSIIITLIGAFRVYFIIGPFKNEVIAQIYVGLFSPFIFFVIGLFLFFISYFFEAKKERKEQLKPILYSVFIAGLVIIYLGIINKPFAIYLSPFLFLPILLFGLIPLSFGYSIFRYGLMDFDRVLRRSLIYGGVTTALATLYLVIIFGVGTLVKSLFGSSVNTSISYIALILIAFFLDPVKRRAQSSIDRIFFREQLNYRRILMDSIVELHTLATVSEVALTTVRRIQSAMHVEKVAITILTVESATITDELSEIILQPSDSFTRLIKSLYKPYYLRQSVNENTDLYQATLEYLQANDIELILPLTVQANIIGSLNIGRKINGKPFSDEDIELLASVALQSAAAIENSRLHESEKKSIVLQEELSTARKIQQGLLPEFDPKIAGFSVTGVSIPALVVGGDYFDYIHIAENQWIVIIADVSGKGMPAALYMAKFQGMMQIAARQYASPKGIFGYINDLLTEVSDKRMFISAAIALIDIAEHKITLCRAGHPAPLLLGANKFDFIRPAGLALGLVKGAKFKSSLEEITLQLDAEDALILYTDGVTETLNKAGDEFGYKRIVSALNSRNFCNAVEIKSALLYDLEIFRNNAEQYDDTTLVIIKSL